MIRKIIEIIEKICSKQVLTSFLVFLIIGSAIFFYTFHKYRYAPDFRRDILVETHGMALDILVIGTFLFALLRTGEKRLERKRNIQRWQEEIDDFSWWNEKEATYRIVGNIRRLNRNSITNINIAVCYLKDAQLQNIQLQGATLIEANLQNANLILANFSGANLNGADLKDADLQHANLQGAYLRGTINLTVEQLSKVKTLYKAKLDPNLEKEIKEKYPHLLEKPNNEDLP